MRFSKVRGAACVGTSPPSISVYFRKPALAQRRVLPPRQGAALRHRHVAEFALWLGALGISASTSALPRPAVGHCSDHGHEFLAAGRGAGPAGASQSFVPAGRSCSSVRAPRMFGLPARGAQRPVRLPLAARSVTPLPPCQECQERQDPHLSPVYQRLLPHPDFLTLLTGGGRTYRGLA